MQTYSIEQAETKNGVRSFILTVNDKKVYHIGELIALLIEKVSEGKTAAQISSSINRNEELKFNLSTEQVQSIIDEKIKPLGLFDASNQMAKTTNAPLSGIVSGFTLTRFERIKGLVNFLKPVFKPAFFYPFFFALLAANIYLIYYILTHRQAAVAQTLTTELPCGGAILYFILFYPCAFLLLYIHELGHASASYQFKVVPKNIGLGFYLIFPVLYTELNGIWKLSRHKKIIVNLGGMYFQLMINLIFIAIVFQLEEGDTKNLVRYLMKLNIFTMLANINPFLKFDGYWIVSDAFHLPNLNQQSNFYLIKGLKFLFPRLPVNINPQIAAIIKPWNPVLIIYSLAKYAFIGFLAYNILYGAVLSAGITGKAIYSMVSTSDYSFCAFENVIKKLFILLLIGNFIRRFVMGIVRSRRAMKSRATAS